MVKARSGELCESFQSAVVADTVMTNVCNWGAGQIHSRRRSSTLSLVTGSGVGSTGHAPASLTIAKAFLEQT